MSQFDSHSSSLQYCDPGKLSNFINVSGTMTSLGASVAVAPAIDAVTEILPRFVKIHELQEAASAEIANATGAEAGFVTASAAAGVTISVAAAVTGTDLGHVARLPRDPGPRSEVAVQLGHLCNYGAPIRQSIELAGGTVHPVGESTQVLDYQLESALGERTAAALYVVSHHVVEYGQMPLRRFAEICHGADVPVIVDAASEYDLKRFLREGADIVVYSAHKFLGGPTAGIVAGHRELVKAAYFQNMGIGRGMKAGKESIYGTIAALRAWEKRDHAAIRNREGQHLELWKQALAEFAGVEAERVPDPTGNPLERLDVRVDPKTAGASAAGVASYLASGKPPVIVRAHELELGHFQLDACNLLEGQAPVVVERLKEALVAAKSGAINEPDPDTIRNAPATSFLNWLSNDFRA